MYSPNKFWSLFVALYSVGIINSCTSADSIPTNKTKTSDLALIDTSSNNKIVETTSSSESNSILDFSLPKGFKLFEKVEGDLNGDGLNDYALIIKGTDTNHIVENQFEKKVDRNRRGILVYLSSNNELSLSLQNLNCFSSEYEDGGVYFPPELGIEIEKGKLFIQYSHGRYGYWKYTFRYQQDDFKLIGYDQSDNHGPVVHNFYSYNFLTSKKLTKENINFYSENPDKEVFKETWEELSKTELKSLKTIKDFDELSFD